MQAIREHDAMNRALFEAEIAHGDMPVALRGQVAEWPAVVEGQRGAEAIARYLARFDSGNEVVITAGAPEIAGRFTFNADYTGFNFQLKRATLTVLLQELLRLSQEASPAAFYSGANSADHVVPGWTEANRLDLVDSTVVPRLWIGNGARIAAHFDATPNVACVVTGKRRFTLVPPDQVANLYLGPLETTVAGVPTSIADLEAPDFERFPRLRDALAAAITVDLEPGDALFIPALWWHQVSSTGPLNVLANYWWEAPRLAHAYPALVHAIIALRSRPAQEREAWRHFFDHFVFADGPVAAHLPEQAQGLLGEPSDDLVAAMMDYVKRGLI